MKTLFFCGMSGHVPSSQFLLNRVDGYVFFLKAVLDIVFHWQYITILKLFKKLSTSILSKIWSCKTRFAMTYHFTCDAHRPSWKHLQITIVLCQKFNRKVASVANSETILTFDPGNKKDIFSSADAAQGKEPWSQSEELKDADMTDLSWGGPLV